MAPGDCLAVCFFATNISIHYAFLNKSYSVYVFLMLYSLLTFVVEGSWGSVCFDFFFGCLFLLVMLSKNPAMKGTIFARL